VRGGGSCDHTRKSHAMKLGNEIFRDADKARKWLEARRWPAGPICPHCANSDQTRIALLHGGAHRSGLYKCNECREQFTVTVKTAMERSHIPLNKWVLAMFLTASSRANVSTDQMRRALNVSHKSAWFIAHRIRKAMREQGLSFDGTEPSAVPSARAEAFHSAI
jgi:transposase-like protein